jgi:hypothetical protein
VHGTQLKALLNCRLPEHDHEYAAAEKSIHSIKWALRVRLHVGYSSGSEFRIMLLEWVHVFAA